MGKTDIGMSHREVARFFLPGGDLAFMVFDSLFSLEGLFSSGNSWDKGPKVAFEHFVLSFQSIISVDLEEVESFILLGQTGPAGF